MAEPALYVLYEMVLLIISNTIGTLSSLLGLFMRFMQSIGAVMGSGFGGFVLGFLVLGLVVFFLAKFVFSSGKTVLVLIAVGVMLLVLLFTGMAMY